MAGWPPPPNRPNCEAAVMWRAASWLHPSPNCPLLLTVMHNDESGETVPFDGIQSAGRVLAYCVTKSANPSQRHFMSIPN